MDEIGAQLDEILGEYIGVGKQSHGKAIDAKFVSFEWSENILTHDHLFSEASITIKISSDCDVEIAFKHDGNDFDPFSENSPCLKIKAAISRMKVLPGSIQVGTSSPQVLQTQKIKFNLLEDGENYDVPDQD